VCLAGATDELADAIIPPVLREARVRDAAVARPLDRGSDGHAIGEGAAVLVLEPSSGRGAAGPVCWRASSRIAGFGCRRRCTAIRATPTS
jgi:hypothetical protein